MLPWTKRAFLCYPSHFPTVQASSFTSCYCQVSFALLIRHVFQVLIITVFMLITSTAPSAKFHTHKHQLPSLFLKAKSQLSHWGTQQCWSRQGRCRHRTSVVQPHTGVAPGSLGMPPRATTSLLCPAAVLAHRALRGQQQAALAAMQRCPHRHLKGCMTPRRALSPQPHPLLFGKKGPDGMTPVQGPGPLMAVTG